MATQPQQELAEQLFAGRGEPSIGALEAVKEAFLAIAPGLKDAGPEIATELKQMGAQGAHELAAALFNGNGFVMYPRGGKDEHGVHGPEQSQDHAQDHQGMQPESPTQEHERGGRSMSAPRGTDADAGRMPIHHAPARGARAVSHGRFYRRGIMHRNQRWWQRLVSRGAWLAVRLQARLRALFHRRLRASAGHDERAALLQQKVQAEGRFNLAQTREAELGSLVPKPTGEQPAGEQAQARERDAHARPPPGRRR